MEKMTSSLKLRGLLEGLKIYIFSEIIEAQPL